MDEQYELISKSKIQEYKNEIAQLKEKLQKNSKKEVKSENKNENSLMFKEVITQIQKESAQEREIVLNQLEDIKDLNKKTLDNILSQNEQLTQKFENLLDTLRHLTSTLTEVVDELPSENTSQISTLLDEIKLSMKNTNHNNNEDRLSNSDPEVLAKLDDIETFMKNLRILLSYVKPNDIKIEK